MTGGDPPKSLWAGSKDDVPRPAPDEPKAQHESLWAGSPAQQRHRLDDVVARWERDETPAPPPRRSHARQPVAPRTALGALAAIVVVALAIALPARDSLAVEDVASYWEDVPMTCHTARFEQGERALELFRCHAVGGGALPPGVYRSPDARWTSDITRRDAQANQMEISPGGELAGWAAY